MGIPASDRFLDCVLNRAGKDVSLNPLILLLIIPGSVSFYLLLLYRIYLDWGIWGSISDSGEYLLTLFLSMDAAFIAYTLITSLTLHTSRNVEWTNALSDYTKENGKDSTQLRALADDMASLRMKNERLVSFLIFAGMVTMMILSFFIFDFDTYYGDYNPFEVPEAIILWIAVLDLSIITVFSLFKVYKVDEIQSRFTVCFAEAMDDEKLTEPMDTHIGEHKRETQIALVMAAIISSVALQLFFGYLRDVNIGVPHISTWIILPGFYFSFLFFYVTHILNKHIRHLWRYENRLLAWMAMREGATGVQRVEVEDMAARPKDRWNLSYFILDKTYSTIKWLKSFFDYS